MTKSLQGWLAKLELAKIAAEKQHPDDMQEDIHDETQAMPPHAQPVQIAHAKERLHQAR
jgi:hypothetical protein